MIGSVRVYVDALYAVAVMAVVGIMLGSMTAAVTSNTQRSVQAALAAFVLTGVLLTIRLWWVTRRRQAAAMQAGNPDAPQ